MKTKKIPIFKKTYCLRLFNVFEFFLYTYVYPRKRPSLLVPKRLKWRASAMTK